MGLFLKILTSCVSANDYGHCYLDALRAPAFRADFADARNRALYLSHSMISELVKEMPEPPKLHGAPA
jgi:hypothetical protein